MHENVAPLLLSISQMLEEQREAIVARDTLELHRICDRLAQLERDLTLSIAAVSNDAEESARVAELSLRLREQIGVTAALLASGSAIIDHFTGCVAESSRAESPLSLSGVA